MSTYSFHLASFAAFLIASLAPVVLLVALVVALVRRRALWRVWIAAVAATIGAVLVLGEVSRPLMDDGPFHGTPRDACDLNTPSSTLVLPYGQQLESFDAVPPDSAPTVRLRSRGGRVKWCIYATGYPTTRVRSVQFREIQSHVVGTTVVRATVDWTFGRERSYWYLGPRGGLRAYYYSW